MLVALSHPVVIGDKPALLVDIIVTYFQVKRMLENLHLSSLSQQSVRCGGAVKDILPK